MRHHSGSPRRSRRQRGNEIIEFALLSVFLVPLLIWTVIVGLDLIRLIQTQQICREVGTLYIRGVDYSTYSAQVVASRLSQGYSLQVGSGFAGGVTNQYNNDQNTGNGWVVLSELMYVGNTGTGSCSTLPVGTACTNHNQYVYLQRIDFGNSTLTINGTTVQSAIGNSTATQNASGYIANYLTDAGAVAPNFSSFLQTGLADGQVIYVVETFFASPDLGFSSIGGGGMYSRNFL